MEFKAYVVFEADTERAVYCGITIRTLSKRWHSHCASKYAIGRAIRKYGKEHFRMVHVASCRCWEDLRETEKQLIAQYGTFAPKGYNLTLGGDGVFGIKFSEEARKKMSESRKGRVWTEDQKANLRAAKAGVVHHMQGKKHTPEALEKIRRNVPKRPGEANPFFGRKHTPEARAKIVEANSRRKWTDAQRAARTGELHPRFGKTHSEETKAKMSQKQSGEKNHNYGVPWSAERRAKHMATLAAKRAAKEN